MLLFQSAYTVPLDPHIVYSLLFSIHLSFLRPINRDYSRLSFNYTTYSANNTGKIASLWSTYTNLSEIQWYSYYWYFFYRIETILRTKQGDCLLLSYTLLKVLCEIGQFLINIVIIVTSFVSGQHRVFVIAIVTCECAISILQKIRFGVCNWY